MNRTTRMLLQRPLWVTQAKCRGTDPNLFHPTRKNPLRPREERLVARLCGSCPVREECLDYALEHHEKGIWGGTTENQRKQMRRVAS